MKVLLINPPSPENDIWVREGRCQQFDIWGSPFPPLSLAYIKSQIRDLAETVLLDPAPAKLSGERLMERISAFSPDVMLMSVTTPTFNSDCNWFAKMIKAALPDIKVGAIGIHVTALPVESLNKTQYLDFVIKGEPEAVVRVLIKAFKESPATKTLYASLKDVPGITYRNGAELIDNPSAGYPDNIDCYGFPDWSDTDFKNYLLPVKERPFSLISFSRGCPYACTFCAASAYYGKRLRKRNIDSLIGEIEYNLSLGVSDFLFWTELISNDLEYLDQFLEKVLEKDLQKKINWVCNSRIDRLDKAILKKMKKAGCWQIAFGLEFGTNKALTLVKKGGEASIEKGMEIIKLADEAGIAADGHFLLGYPGETEDDIKETVNYAVSLPLTFAHFYMATPFPGSELFDYYMENRGRDIRHDYWDDIAQHKYVFSDDGLTGETVNKYVSMAYRKFYFSLYRVYKISRTAQGIKEKINLVKTGTKFLSGILIK
ncbi:MAG: radical SAM protein [Nitrospirae bacterium]|nr:radical SAM protein [Nitrospirota bacterium]